MWEEDGGGVAALRERARARGRVREAYSRIHTYTNTYGRGKRKVSFFRTQKGVYGFFIGRMTVVGYFKRIYTYDLSGFGDIKTWLF